jgi:DNA-binding NarL/FixJ family response regulator
VTAATVERRPPNRELLPLAGKPLGEREKQVLNLVSLGLANKQIARRLHISDHTVKTHLCRIFAKLEVPDRAGAVAEGFRRGDLTPRPLHPDAVVPPMPPLFAVLLPHLVRGRTNGQISTATGLTKDEVKARVTVLMSFLGADGREHAIRIAVEAGYLELGAPPTTPVDVPLKEATDV